MKLFIRLKTRVGTVIINAYQIIYVTEALQPKGLKIQMLDNTSFFVDNMTIEELEQKIQDALY